FAVVRQTPRRSAHFANRTRLRARHRLAQSPSTDRWQPAERMRSAGGERGFRSLRRSFIVEGFGAQVAGESSFAVDADTPCLCLHVAFADRETVWLHLFGRI